MALRNSRTGSLPVSEIYSFMTEHFPYFKVLLQLSLQCSSFRFLDRKISFLSSEVGKWHMFWIPFKYKSISLWKLYRRSYYNAQLSIAPGDIILAQS